MPPVRGIYAAFTHPVRRRAVLAVLKAAVFPSNPSLLTSKGTSYVMQFLNGMAIDFQPVIIATVIARVSASTTDSEEEFSWSGAIGLLALLPLLALGAIMISSLGEALSSIANSAATATAAHLVDAHLCRLGDLDRSALPKLNEAMIGAYRMGSIVERLISSSLVPLLRLLTLFSVQSQLLGAPWELTLAMLVACIVQVVICVLQGTNTAASYSDLYNEMLMSRHAPSTLDEMRDVESQGSLWFALASASHWQRVSRVAWSSITGQSKFLHTASRILDQSTYGVVVGLASHSALNGGQITVGQIVGLAATVQSMLSKVNQATRTIAAATKDWNSCELTLDALSTATADEDAEWVAAGFERWWESPTDSLPGPLGALEKHVTNSLLRQESYKAAALGAADIDTSKAAAVKPETFPSDWDNLLTLFRTALATTMTQTLPRLFKPATPAASRSAIAGGFLSDLVKAFTPSEGEPSKATVEHKRMFLEGLWRVSAIDALALAAAEERQFMALTRARLPSEAFTRDSELDVAGVVERWKSQTRKPPRIEFRDVQFSYPASTTASSEHDGVSSSETTAGVSSSETTAGVSSSDTTAGVSTSDTTAGVSTRDTTAGVSSSDTTAGVSSSDTTAGVSSSETTGTPKPVLKGLSFVIEPGSTVAIVGRSGAGKSTIARLLTRTYTLRDPGCAGQVLMDGADIAQLPSFCVRNRIAVVAQDTVVATDSLLNNIRIASPAQSFREAVVAGEAAALSGVAAKLPSGWNTLVGDGNVRLSGGERQRCAIARALLRDCGLLLLDEATSSLDSETETAIQATLKKAADRRTCVIIAHRLGTIRKADKILVVDDGRVVEEGIHKDLVAAGGLYASLWNLQSGALSPIARHDSAEAFHSVAAAPSS